jgi:DNA invertase Pin-like site-specific DNA recombinase
MLASSVPVGPTRKDLHNACTQNPFDFQSVPLKGLCAKSSAHKTIVLCASRPCMRVSRGVKQTVVIYARVSTDKQTTDSQLASLREYCARHDWQDVQVITDTISGSKSSRKGLDALMKAVRAGKVAVVLSYNLDRLGRSLSHLMLLLGEFAAHKVALIVPGQGINTSSSNPASALLLNMLGAIAQFEHSIIVERVNAGLAAARRRGIKLGRPATLDAHRENVARLRAKGMTGRAIAKEIGIPSSSVFKLLRERQKCRRSQAS